MGRFGTFFGNCGAVRPEGGIVPLIRSSVRTGPPSPLGGRFAGGHRPPLRRDIRTRTVSSESPGAGLEPYQFQFLQTQGPCGPGIKSIHAHRSPRAGNFLTPERGNLRNGGPGESSPMDLGGAKRSRSPSAASPGDPLGTFPSGGLSSEVQRFVEKEFKRRFPA